MDAHLTDEAKLRFQKVDMLFLAGENIGEEITADKIAHIFTMGDGIPQHRQHFIFQIKVGLEDFFNRFTDAQTPKHLEIGQAIQEQDTLGQLVGMLHLVDRFMAFHFRQLLHAQIIEQPVMQPILIDRGQLVLQCLVQKFDDFCIALHGFAPDRVGCIIIGMIGSFAKCESQKKNVFSKD